ncbi:hypothetical protein ABU178_03740 [Pantoea osteomyelitidis]|uniref:Uncharacterized protein n=1 Tax=Pantoea osteomyelitidis TaxID=3230026 RepID=A0ABW7PSK9_9GAMM
MVDVAALLLEGPLAASALQARLNISQATLSRAVQQNRQILKWAKARATRYALLRPLRGESAIPLWRVSEQRKTVSADAKISSGFREIARQASDQLQACDNTLSQMA